MPGATIRHIGTANGVSTYKVVDAKVEGGEATVTVFKWDADNTWNAHCMACDAYKCIHADRALRRAKDGR